MAPSHPWDGGPPLAEDEAEDLLRCICFKTGPPRSVGVELEWFVHDLHRPSVPVSRDRLQTAFSALHALGVRSSLTLEPGGQLELSSPPAASLAECVAAVSADLAAVRTALAARGLTLTGSGTDPWLPQRERILREPRYDAMEAYLDRWGTAGRSMMRDSASVQVCLDTGHAEPGPLSMERRWRLAHMLGPVLVASFANSPCCTAVRRGCGPAGSPCGWPSTPAGARAARGARAAGRLGGTCAGHPRHVRTQRRRAVDGAGGPDIPPVAAAGSRRLRAPVREDLDYHLTTLFPPVRPAEPPRTAHAGRPVGGRRLDRAARRGQRAPRRPAGRRRGVPAAGAARRDGRAAARAARRCTGGPPSATGSPRPCCTGPRRPASGWPWRQWTARAPPPQ